MTYNYLENMIEDVRESFEENKVSQGWDKLIENNDIQTLHEEMYDFMENERYVRFRNLIDTRFPNNQIIHVLSCCETRDSDNEIIDMFGGEADVPTIFEYIVGIAWYRLSRKKRKTKTGKTIFV